MGLHVFLIFKYGGNNDNGIIIYLYKLINLFYSGLILQDLTFVDIGNNELMADGNVNFSKRWQQFNILDNMKRFKKW